MTPLVSSVLLEQNWLSSELPPKFARDTHHMSVLFPDNDHAVHNKPVFLIGADEMFVPILSEHLNWDELLIHLLQASIETFYPFDKGRYCKGSAQSPIVLKNIFKYFTIISSKCTQIITHPEQKVYHYDFINIHTSEYCPKDFMFFLPSPEELGLFITKADTPETNIAIIAAEKVVGLQIR